MQKLTHPKDSNHLIVALEPREMFELRLGADPITVDVNEAIPDLNKKVKVTVVANEAQLITALGE